MKPPQAPRLVPGRVDSGLRPRQNRSATGGHGLGMRAPRPMQREDPQESSQSSMQLGESTRSPRHIGTPRTPYTPRMGGSVTIHGNSSSSSATYAGAAQERPRDSSTGTRRKASPRGSSPGRAGGAGGAARRARSWTPPKRGARSTSLGSEKHLPPRWRQLVAQAYQEAIGKPLVDRIRLLECNSAPGRKADPHVYWLHVMVRWGDLRLVESERRPERGEDLTLFVLHCQRAVSSGATSESTLSGAQPAHGWSVNAPHTSLPQQSRRQRQCQWDTSEEPSPPGRRRLERDVGWHWSVVSVRVLNSLSAFSDTRGSNCVKTGTLGAALFLSALGPLLRDDIDMSPTPSLHGQPTSGQVSPAVPNPGAPVALSAAGTSGPSRSSFGFSDGSLSVPTSLHGMRTPVSPATTPGVPPVPPLLLGNINSKTGPPAVNIKPSTSARSSRGAARGGGPGRPPGCCN